MIVDVEVGLEAIARRQDHGAADRVVGLCEHGGRGVAQHGEALQFFERHGALVGGETDEHRG